PMAARGDPACLRPRRSCATTGAAGTRRANEGRRAATPATGSYAMCGELHKRTSIFMLKAVRAAQDHGLEEANQPAQQGSNSMDVQNLAQVKAELTHLARL